jgi:SWI/SNF-related matrix-associated actin-dependent regulator 1 of chromatin subfamily A
VLRFQNDAQVRVIIVGIQAGGFGLTLTAARAVAFVQLPWTPGEISQCVDRIHRIGQDADNVTVFNLVAEGTLEEDMAEMLIGKGQVLDAVLDAGRVVNTLDLKIEGK